MDIALITINEDLSPMSHPSELLHSDSKYDQDLEWSANHESYELIGKIGQGAFATVWHGINRITGQDCAIKIIDLDNIDTNFVGTIEKCFVSHIMIYFCNH